MLAMMADAIGHTKLLFYLDELLIEKSSFAKKGSSVNKVVLHPTERPVFRYVYRERHLSFASSCLWPAFFL